MRATLALPTGRLIIGDPSVLFGDAKPLGPPLPAGDHPVSVGPRGLELSLGEGEPDRWDTVAPGFDTPSGHLCLLDESALKEFTDLGDEPVDEYELLTERLRERPGEPVEFRGLLVFPAAGPVRAVRAVRAGCDRNGRCTRITAQF